MHASRSCSALMTAAALAVTTVAAGATTLTMENVINRVPGSGPAGPDDPFFTFGFYQPGGINPATGEPNLAASKPGEIAYYPAGVPRDEALVDAVRVFNNTAYNITSLKLQIVGTAVEPEPGNFTFTLDPSVSAFWGDVNGDGETGLSDIFSTITVSDDRRTTIFSDGLIPVGGRFTDFIFSATDDGAPFTALVFASFDGVFVPEPATWTVLLTGLVAGGLLRRRTLRPRS
jgi:hypothetical protein